MTCSDSPKSLDYPKSLIRYCFMSCAIFYLTACNHAQMVPNRPTETHKTSSRLSSQDSAPVSTLESKPDKEKPIEPKSQIKPASSQEQAQTDSGPIMPVQDGSFRKLSGSKKRLKKIIISAPEDSPVRAVEPGKVGYTGIMNLYGKVVLIEHSDRVVTVYAGLKEVKALKGQPVGKGAIIGTVGRINGQPGIHFEVRSKSLPIDPIAYLTRPTLRAQHN